MNLCATFTPEAECNSWKRLAIVLSNADPLNIDLLGSGYSPTARPPRLPPLALHDFLHRVADGGPVVPPAQLADGDLPADAAAFAPKTLGVFGAQSWDLLFDGQDVARGLAVEPSALEFAPTEAGHGGESRRVEVTNRLPFAVTARIVAPPWMDPAGATKPARVWAVSPAACELEAGATAAFQVAFQPPVDGRYFAHTLDVVASARHMRNFRLCAEVRRFTVLQTTSRPVLRGICFWNPAGVLNDVHARAGRRAPAVRGLLHCIWPLVRALAASRRAAGDPVDT